MLVVRIGEQMSHGEQVSALARPIDELRHPVTSTRLAAVAGCLFYAFRVRRWGNSVPMIRIAPIHTTTTLSHPVRYIPTASTAMPNQTSAHR